MDTNSDFDPLEQRSEHGKTTVKRDVRELADLLQAKQSAFRDVADRFYMLWWNLPQSDLREVDRQVQDLFRMFMDLAPSMGVSRNGISELRECCGRRRSQFKDGSGDPNESINGTDQIVVRAVEEKLGRCPGDLIRRFTRMLGFQYCERCDRRRRAINAFFRCG